MNKKKVQHYLVKPFDVLFFRNNRAFDFGEWYSEGIFPPLPSTFQGFVRTSILRKMNLFDTAGKINWDEAKEIIGDDKDFPFDLRGPFLFSESDEWFFPAPRDLLLDETNGEARQTRISSKMIQTDIGSFCFSRDSQKSYYLCFDDETVPLRKFNEYRRFGKYCYQPVKPVATEEHFGIKLQYENINNNRKTKKAHDHHFYLTPYKRLSENAAFYFSLQHNIKNLDLNGQHGRLGSEARGAVVESCSQQLHLKLEDSFYRELAEQMQFKLILLQPGIFKTNWLPFERKTDDKNKENIQLTYNGLSLQLIFVQTDQKLKISGMNFKVHNKESGNDFQYNLKAMLNAVPAGAVYYFKILADHIDKEHIAETLGKLDDSKLQSGNEKYPKMGYNHVVLGKII